MKNIIDKREYYILGDIKKLYPAHGSPDFVK